MSKKIVDQILKELLSSVKSIKDFSKEQLPEMAQSLLVEYEVNTKAYLFISILGIFLGLIVAGFAAFIFYKGADPEKFYNIEPQQGLSILLGGSASLTILACSIHEAVSQYKDLIILKRAPKAVLLHMIRSKIG